MGSICPNHIKFQLKSTERLSLMTLKSDAKFKEKLVCGFKHDMRNLVNFKPTSQKSENYFSMGSFCPKYTRFELLHDQLHCSYFISFPSVRTSLFMFHFISFSPHFIDYVPFLFPSVHSISHSHLFFWLHSYYMFIQPYYQFHFSANPASGN